MLNVAQDDDSGTQGLGDFFPSCLDRALNVALSQPIAGTGFCLPV